MGLFDKLKGVFSKSEEGEEDYFKIAQDFEAKGQLAEAINEYEKLIFEIYKDRDYTKYIHLTKKLVELNINLGNYGRVIELWPKQYAPEEYTLRKKLELALLLEKAGKVEDSMKIYDGEEGRLQLPKIEFLMRLRRIDEANAECTRLLLSMRADNPKIIDVWMLKGKMLMGIRRWEEAQSYFIKILEKQGNNLDAKKLKIFCGQQLRA